MSLLSRFFPQSHTRSHTLVINIGSATVSAALVDTGASPATILASESADITILPDLATPAFETETKRVIGVVLDRIAKLALPLPDAIAVYLASPWYASQVRMAKTSRPAPFVVSRSVVEDIISR
jgi:predicted aspartyl protease